VSWIVHYAQTKHHWLSPLLALEWGWSWLAYWLSGWAFLEVLEYFGTLSLLIAVISYFAESKDRIKQKHYQAWQVINSSQGKGGSGGRIDALEELRHDGVDLVGVDVSGAFLEGIDLSRANLLRSSFHAADIRRAKLSGAQLELADLVSANLRSADLQDAHLQDAQLQDADLFGADLRGADLTGANLSKADLRNTDLRNAKWQEIADIKLANIFGITGAPNGFIEWALRNGAVATLSDDEWTTLQDQEKMGITPTLAQTPN
jgi:uncharacterized protein YjbI with pentapeptide repeats